VACLELPPRARLLRVFCALIASATSMIMMIINRFERLFFVKYQCA